MTQPSPADTLRAAADKLRGRTNVGAYTATQAGAALLRARELTQALYRRQNRSTR